MVKLEVRDAAVRRGGRAILDRARLSLGSGDRLAIVGPNGSGKTTLLKVALGRLFPDAGSVTIDGRSVRSLSPVERAGRVGWLPQQDAVEEPIAAVDVVATARYRFGEPWARALEAARGLLEEIGIEDLSERPYPQLSGGERQQVALAALLAQEAPLLLLDEPGNHLDPIRKDQVFQFVGRLANETRGVCVVTHDLFALSALGPPSAVRVIGLDRGGVVFEMTLDDPAMAAAFSEIFARKLLRAEVAGRPVFVPEMSAP